MYLFKTSLIHHHCIRNLHDDQRYQQSEKPVEEVKGPSQEELLTEIRDLLKNNKNLI